MAKFHLRLKVQGLELEVDGERQDIPALTNAVARQLTGLMEGGEAAANGTKALPAAPQVIDVDGTGKARGSRRRSGTRASSESASPFEFRHDPDTYANPLQAWSIADKCIWLLFVLKGASVATEASAAQLTATFNAQFKTAGRLHPPLVARELAKAKGENPAPIGEDKGNFFLTAEGDRQAKELVQAAKTGQ